MSATTFSVTVICLAGNSYCVVSLHGNEHFMSGVSGIAGLFAAEQSAVSVMLTLIHSPPISAAWFTRSSLILS